MLPRRVESSYNGMDAEGLPRKQTCFSSAVQWSTYSRHPYSLITTASEYLAVINNEFYPYNTPVVEKHFVPFLKEQGWTEWPTCPVMPPLSADSDAWNLSNVRTVVPAIPPALWLAHGPTLREEWVDNKMPAPGKLEEDGRRAQSQVNRCRSLAVLPNAQAAFSSFIFILFSTLSHALKTLFLLEKKKKLLQMWFLIILIVAIVVLIHALTTYS